MRTLNCKNLLIIITLYVFARIILMINNTIFYINIINPIFWACILVYLLLEMKNNYIRFSVNIRYFKYMIVISCVYILTYFYFGFILGFYKSPYGHDVSSILANIFTQIFPVIVIEFVRGFILNRNKNSKLICVIITTLLILVELNYNTFYDLYLNKRYFFEYLCSTVLPLITFNILYTYLSLQGSYLFTLIFRTLLKLFILLLPILTHINWFIAGLAGILSPIIIYVLFIHKFGNHNIKKHICFCKFCYLFLYTLYICIICFILGVFKYQPITILSNSMSSTFNRADMVVFKKLNEDEIKNIPKGTIIVYSMDNKNITHRVIDTINVDGTVKYKTKGDSNNMPDKNLVSLNQIKGIYVFHVKYIGCPFVWLYEYFNN